jgi:hypothetical protein
METRNLTGGGAPLSSSAWLITPEEYAALMSEQAQESIPDPVTTLSEVEARLKRLEFNLMILAGLILTVFLVCRAG